MRVLECPPEDAAHAVAVYDESDEPVATATEDRSVERPVSDRVQQTIDWIEEHVLSGNSQQYNQEVEQRGGQ